MPPIRKLLIAIAIGVGLAGPPAVAFNLWLSHLGERHSQQELDIAARRSLALAEARVARSVEALEMLASRGIDSCRPAHVEALRQTTFATVPVKEFSIVAPDGRTLCSDVGVALEQRSVMSSERVAPGSDVLLEVIRLGDRPNPVVRLRRPGSGTANGVAALIPPELFTMNVSNQGTAPNSYVRVSTRGGQFIGEAGPSPAAAADAGGRIGGTRQSGRYALDIAISLRRDNATLGESDLRVLGIGITALLAILILSLALLIPERSHDNPVAELEQALKDGEFVPFYQPIVDIRSGRLRGAEVLMRWRRADGTIVPPSSFIPLAESSGLIVEMTRTMMRQVSREMGAQLAQRPHLKVSFNLTATHFADEAVVEDVRQIFGKSQIRMSQIVLEVTERQPLDNLTETRRVVAALQGLGVRVAIDDVGTGHSGLSYMLKLGVDIIKIDKMFIDSLGTDRNSNTIIETLIDLAQNMRMDIIAEGVESFEQVVHLRELGIRAAQGFVFAPPLPSSAFLQLIGAIDPPKAAPQQDLEETRSVA